MVNKLEFEQVKAPKTEKWWDDFPAYDHHGIIINIDGEDLIETFGRLERELNPAIRTPALENYGHIPAMWLHRSLSAGYEEDCEFGSTVCCCADCGLDSCYSFSTHIHHDEQHVYWGPFEHCADSIDYQLHFKFDKVAYLAQMERLRRWAQEEVAEEAAYYSEKTMQHQ